MSTSSSQSINLLGSDQDTRLEHVCSVWIRTSTSTYTTACVTPSSAACIWAKRRTSTATWVSTPMNRKRNRCTRTGSAAQVEKFSPLTRRRSTRTGSTVTLETLCECAQPVCGCMRDCVAGLRERMRYPRDCWPIFTSACGFC